MTNTFERYKSIPILLFCLVCFIQCGVQNQSMTYFYTDQNNNRFTISSAQVSYIPIKASESSSGTYDGGEKKSVSIDSETFKKIAALAENILSKEHNPDQKRRMMTAILSVKNEEKFSSRIIQTSEERTALESLLRDLIK